MITPTNHNHYTPSFTSKCVQIRDADWVCHIINKTFPHTSTTKHETRITNFFKKHKEQLKYNFTPQSLDDVYNFVKNFEKTSDKKLDNILYAIKNMMDNFAEKRSQADQIMPNHVLQALYCFENFKIANCSEHAILAELILKLNGIKNATYAAIYKVDEKYGKHCLLKDSLDHAVCIFNKDGTPFNGEVNKHTIIVDPWINKAGFAKDMERFYSHQFPNTFKLKPSEIIVYDHLPIVSLLDKAHLKKIKKKYHPFIFKNENRDFMQNTKSTRLQKVINNIKTFFKRKPQSK